MGENTLHWYVKQNGDLEGWLNDEVLMYCIETVKEYHSTNVRLIVHDLHRDHHDVLRSGAYIMNAIDVCTDKFIEFLAE